MIKCLNKMMGSFTLLVRGLILSVEISKEIKFKLKQFTESSTIFSFIQEMLIKTLIIVVVVSCCLGDFSDFVVRQDDLASKFLTDPHGSDTDMYNALKTVGDSYALLTKYIRNNNASLLDDSKKLYDRGTPNVLTQVFSTDNMRVYYGWSQSDLHYFNFVYNDVETKWNTFRRVFKNASNYM